MVRGRKNPLHYGFARRLAHTRIAADIAGPALSLAVDMHRAAASGLEAGGRIPRVDTVEKIAAALNVSPCLLAYGVEQPCDAANGSLSSGLPDRLLQLREERGLSRRALGRLSGTSDNFVQKTESRATVPTIANVEALAKALAVPPCWLAYGLGPKELPPRLGRAAVPTVDSAR